MTLGTDVALQRKLEDYCDIRARSLALIEHGLKAFADAADLVNGAVTYGWPSRLAPDGSLEEFRKEIDSRFWQFTLDRTGLTRLMDAEALGAMRRELQEGKAPEFTLEAITTQVLSMHQTAGEMFARGVYNVFRQVHRWKGAYKTNEREPFAIGRKVVLEYWFEPCWSSGLSVRYGRQDLINDIDRVVSLFAGQPYTPRRLSSALEGAFRGRPGPWVYEDAQLRVKGFKNGNAHLEFRDQAVLDKINDTIAAYCDGRAVPASADPSYGRAA